MSHLLPLLEGLSQPDRAAALARRHPGAQRFLGVPNPQIDALVRPWRDARPVGDWLAEARALWASDVVEARIAAARLLTKARLREAEGQVWDQLCTWVPQIDAAPVADPVCAAAGRRLIVDLARLETLAGWVGDDNPWCRAASLDCARALAKLAHPAPDQRAARGRVTGWAGTLDADPHPAPRAAVAAWLRSLARRDPGVVARFRAEHGVPVGPAS